MVNIVIFHTPSADGGNEENVLKTMSNVNDTKHYCENDRRKKPEKSKDYCSLWAIMKK